MVAGCLVAAAGFFINVSMLKTNFISPEYFTRYAAPFIEETLKVLPIVYLMRRHKIGFIVDGAIFGFAVGTGFALVENLYYLHSIQSTNLFLWIIRGFGTAIMHGGTTTLFAIISKGFSERHDSQKWGVFLPGFLVAYLVHAAFNHFILPPLITTLMQLIILPSLIYVAFAQSERALRHWLELGMDTDVNLLEFISTGKMNQTKTGQYIYSLKNQFPGEVVADMLCYLRLHLELAIRAKGILLMREAGFKAPVDPEIQEKFSELKYLEKSMGKTGKLAMTPILNTSTRDLWQIYFVEKN